MDTMPSETRSQLMSRIRGKDTTPERYMEAGLKAAGLEFEKHVRSLPGTPDFVLAQYHAVIFVDGDFWHGWRFPSWKHKLSARWQDKIEATRSRDRKNHAALRRRDWVVIRIWEHEIETDIAACISKIEAKLQLAQLDWPSINRALAMLPALRRRKRLPKP